MKRNMLILAAVAAVGMVASGAQAVTVVHSFAATNGTPGVWGVSDIETGGTASVVANAPAGIPAGFGPGSAVITTTSSGTSKAEVGITNNYGTGNVLSTIGLAYSYYKENAGSDAAAAPSIKLTFYDPTYNYNASTDGYVTLIYEPYFNTVGNPADNTWLTANITSTSGEFWENGGFGQANQSGGAYLTNNTLAGWLAAFNSTSGGAFGSSATTLVGVEIGLGSVNPSITGYFDKVSINGTAIADTTYNFEPTTVPLPATASSGLALLAGLGLVGGIKRLRSKRLEPTGGLSL